MKIGLLHMVTGLMALCLSYAVKKTIDAFRKARNVEKDKEEDCREKDYREKKDDSKKKSYREKKDFGQKEDDSEKKGYREKKDFKEKGNSEKKEYREKEDNDSNKQSSSSTFTLKWVPPKDKRKSTQLKEQKKATVKAKENKTDAKATQQNTQKTVKSPSAPGSANKDGVRDGIDNLLAVRSMAMRHDAILKQFTRGIFGGAILATLAMGGGISTGNSKKNETPIKKPKEFKEATKRIRPTTPKGQSAEKNDAKTTTPNNSKKMEPSPKSKSTDGSKPSDDTGNIVSTCKGDDKLRTTGQIDAKSGDASENPATHKANNTSAKPHLLENIRGKTVLEVVEMKSPVVNVAVQLTKDDGSDAVF